MSSRVFYSSRHPTRIINKSGYPLEYATEGSVGLDLRCVSGRQDIRIDCGNRWIMNTGIYIELPVDHFAMVLPRSGLARDHGVVAVTGVIDNDYRGEIKVTMINLGNSNNETGLIVRPGDKIANLVIMPFTRALIEEATELTSTDRGAKGFGSSGR